MKIIETKGITYLEKLDFNDEWYWGSNFSCGDLYEAEEVYRSGGTFTPNRLIFVHFPDGKVVEPLLARKNQYFGSPIFVDGVFYILLIDFEEKLIRIFNSSADFTKMNIETEISLQEVKDCYNLGLSGSPLMLTREGTENDFQIIWPQKVEFKIGERESFICRMKDQLYFSEWHEDDQYREEVNIREFTTGVLIKKIKGAYFTTKNNVSWILQ